MTTNVVESSYASAKRSDQQSVRETFEMLRDNETLSMVLDAMPHLVAILDENRQIVAANAALREAFSTDQVDQILGARPGELVQCSHSTENEGGCGTSEACRNCGAVNAILGSQAGKAGTLNCQISTNEPGQSLDLQVTASPIQIGGRNLTIVSIQNLFDENRRKVLERTFFHDVLNAAGGALGIANLLAESDSMEEIQEFAPLLVIVMDQLIDEVRSQQDMLSAERGELTVKTEDFGTMQLLVEVQSMYGSHPVCEGRNLELNSTATDRLIHTSKTLLHRILGNMVKNALEATDPGGTVRLGCEFQAGEYCFWVNNPEAMSRPVQLQVFNRSFSTKGPGRGIGTYSMRLLGENYLGGRVSFDSNDTDGTTFRIHLPTRPADLASR